MTTRKYVPYTPADLAHEVGDLCTVGWASRQYRWPSSGVIHLDEREVVKLRKRWSAERSRTFSDTDGAVDLATLADGRRDDEP